MRRAAAILAALWMACVATVAAESSAAADEKPQVSVPVTIEKIWYRSGGKKRLGDLTITADELEVQAKKKSFVIPLDRIQVISYGKMKKNVETDWIVMSVGVSQPFDIVGIRDGSKWGFGSRTREVYFQLRSLLRRLGAAQYRVEQGYQVYEDPDASCALAIPDNWSTYLDSVVLVGSRSPSGTTIFSEEPIRSTETTPEGVTRPVDDLETLDALLAGEISGFFVERLNARSGMSCEGFSRGARERMLDRVREDPLFGESCRMQGVPETAEHTVGECEALRVIGRCARDDGKPVLLDLVATASGETLYVFGLRALEERYEKDLEVFERALSTVKFSVAVSR